MGERNDFDRAKGALDRGEFQLAATELQRFTDTYPGSPLSGEAHFWRGEALAALGDQSGAARAYLDSFSGDPQGVMAADALLQLGLALDRLGQRQESCVMLGEVTVRFPSSAASMEAQAARGSMGCV
jgi:tol-pal system protein YbgF